ncbi:MAG: aspartate-semialdehyde dehydrogenase [Gemmatimonadetes bacterium]|nr:aspartate-semialdehyde dehydrogenase [Gemmatimonadota bacterium]
MTRSHPGARIPVGLLGATGIVGQNFAVLLQDHPWFRLAWVGASERSAGRSYADAVRWVHDRPMPTGVADLVVESAEPGVATPELVFSAIDGGVAGAIERSFAHAGHIVLSNARSHRLADDVPLLVPEVNTGHLALIERQRRERGWSGAIVTNPNCATVTLALALAPIRHRGIRRVVVTTLQAVSGAGYPGVSAIDALGNVVPFIAGEEDKVPAELRKLFGSLDPDLATVAPAPVRVSAHCNRVATLDGHLLCVSVELEERAAPADVLREMASFAASEAVAGLPSAPRRPVVVASDADRPQPRRDAMASGGMTVTVGRIRPCPVLGISLVALGHNTIRGAAGASILNAELMLCEGLIGGDRGLPQMAVR